MASLCCFDNFTSDSTEGGFKNPLSPSASLWISICSFSRCCSSRRLRPMSYLDVCFASIEICESFVQFLSLHRFKLRAKGPHLALNSWMHVAYEKMPNLVRKLGTHPADKFTILQSWRISDSDSAEFRIRDWSRSCCEVLSSSEVKTGMHSKIERWYYDLW